MKRFMWISYSFISSAFFFGTASEAFAQAATQNISAQASVTTGACSGAGCQPATAPSPGNCNNGAGPNPAKNISVTISLCQVNGMLRGIGTGTGFEFGKSYVSLLYKNPNTGTCSRSPDDLTPLTIASAADPRVDSDFASMMLGIWRVNPDGSGSGILIVNKQAPVPGLQSYRTASVREMQVANTNCYRADLDPAPQLNALRACGPLAFGPACSASYVCQSLCANSTTVCDAINGLDPVDTQALCALLDGPAPAITPPPD